MIGHDQASGAGPDRLLNEPIERAAQLHQARAFVLEHLPDRPVLELWMLGPLCVGDALIFQPGIQLDEALYPRLGPEHLVAQIADLVLDLTLLPSRGWSAGHWFDQMVRAHLQKTEIISARLADEDRLDCRLHVVVDAAPAQLLEQPLRRPAFSLRQLGFLLQDLRQNLDPCAELGRGLNSALVLELDLVAPHDLAHRRARYRQR